MDTHQALATFAVGGRRLGLLTRHPRREGPTRIYLTSTPSMRSRPKRTSSVSHTRNQ